MSHSQVLHYRIADLMPYINWVYFYHAWGLTGKARDGQEKMRGEAERLLDLLDQRYQAHALFGLFNANSDGDDLLLGETRLPLLRQQGEGKGPSLCLADFVRPLSMGVTDRVGVFATTVDYMLETDFRSDDYDRMLVQTLADRLAEAAAERMHEEVRKNYWGYAPDENLTPDELHRETYQGIRPAIGYPSLPDTSVNFILDGLLGLKRIGIRLTESGMMVPHASVSGLMLAHPKARYFDVGPIGEDQLTDYSRRRGMPVELMRRFLASSLLRR